ncbi:hypothetical protein CALCODRAFT_9292 [Calocera cornea HHB12733]|uniref:Uncharacterized protein n=1 Tax=Calocera cornea HHB12733 TaxID=1353952 RepID=A0A165J5Q3_9BASI|nr:hypothetical protein CALCODRAFT_9292 [Calocera cornea HHB12733]
MHIHSPPCEAPTQTQCNTVPHALPHTRLPPVHSPSSPRTEVSSPEYSTKVWNLWERDNPFTHFQDGHRITPTSALESNTLLVGVRADAGAAHTLRARGKRAPRARRMNGFSAMGSRGSSGMAWHGMAWHGACDRVSQWFRHSTALPRAHG